VIETAPIRRRIQIIRIYSPTITCNLCYGLGCWVCSVVIQSNPARMTTVYWQKLQAYYYLTNINTGKKNVLMILVIKSASYTTRSKEKKFVPNISKSLQTTLAEIYSYTA
jgi:nitrate reductase NapAB chaperone NapD